VTNLFGSYLVNRLGHRWSLVVGGCTYTVYVAANIYPLAYVLLPASAVIGMGAAVIWTAQGAYLSDNSSVTTLGLFSGVFWFFFQCNYVIGPLTAAQLINDEVPEYILYSVLTVVCMLGTLSFFLLSYSDSNNVRVLHPLDQLRLFADTRIQHMICMMIFSGITQSFYFGGCLLSSLSVVFLALLVLNLFSSSSSSLSLSLCLKDVSCLRCCWWCCCCCFLF
jgi:MFS transporter, NAG-T family, sugar:H+ symporter